MKPLASHLQPAFLLQIDRVSVDKDQPISFNDLSHWNSVAQGIQRDFRFIRGKTFEKVHLIIHDFLSSNRDLPRENLNHDAMQAGYKLREAALKDNVDMELLEEEFIDFAFSIQKQLQKVEAGNETETAPFTHYGGSLGNAIYSVVNAELVVPLLTSFLKSFAHQTKDLTYDEKQVPVQEFLRDYLVLAGAERGKIAKMTATPNYEVFGKYIVEGSSLIDSVANCSKSWEAMVSSKINEVIAPAWQVFLKENESAKLKNFLPEQVKPWERIQLQMRNSPIRDVLLWKKEGSCVQLEDRQKFGLFRDDDPSNKGLRARYWFDWSPQNDRNKAMTNPVEISRLRCVHADPYLEKERVNESLLAPDVLEALHWTGELQQLQDRLASIYHGMSHSSIFPRGQASISANIIKSIAAFHGYALDFSQDWTPPDHPAPDQHALMQFDRDKFILDARKNILMRKV